MYIRSRFLHWMQQHVDTPFVKVITGMRRVGKSTLLHQFRNWLIAEHTDSAAHTLLIDMESVEFHHITGYRDLHDKVQNAFAGLSGNKYLLIDEVQEINQWEKAIASLQKNRICDICITGSNAHLLSSDLATFLAGRYVQREVYPFSYQEYTEALGAMHNDKTFQDYLTFGGFPGITFLPEERTIKLNALGDLYSSIVLRDVVARYDIRNVSTLEQLISFFFDNIGNPVTAKSVSDFLKSQRVSVSIDTVQAYMGYLSACYALHRVRRFDIKGKRFLELYEKHYLGDIGLRHALLGYRPGDIGQLLENLVYLELKQRGYSVSVGKSGAHEIDFVAEMAESRVYIQVAYLLGSPETREREFGALKTVSDAYPKYVLTMDLLRQNDNGIQHRYIPDFLLGEEL